MLNTFNKKDLISFKLNELAAPTVNIPVPIISSANIRSVTEGTTLGWYEVIIHC